jgi:hypothetical protein
VHLLAFLKLFAYLISARNMEHVRTIRQLFGIILAFGFVFNFFFNRDKSSTYEKWDSPPSSSKETLVESDAIGWTTAVTLTRYITPDIW